MTFEQVQERLKEITEARLELLNGTRSVIIVPDEPEVPVYDVVWAGGELLPSRESAEDDRLRFVPSYDIDDGQTPERVTAKRQYNWTGNHTKEKKAAAKSENTEQ